MCIECSPVGRVGRVWCAAAFEFNKFGRHPLLSRQINAILYGCVADFKPGFGDKPFKSITSKIVMALQRLNQAVGSKPNLPDFALFLCGSVKLLEFANGPAKFLIAPQQFPNLRRDAFCIRQRRTTWIVRVLRLVCHK